MNEWHSARTQTHSLRYLFFAEILGAAFYGTWRSLVARTLGVGEAPSSNLGVPTKLGFQSSLIGSPFALSEQFVQSFQSVITIGDVSVLCTGHLCAISCRRVSCSSLSAPSNETERSMRCTYPSGAFTHSAQSLA